MSPAQPSLPAKSRELRRVPRIIWYILAAFAAVQLYFVQELLAALIVFAMLFGIVAVIALTVFVVGRAGNTALNWAEDTVHTAHPSRYVTRFTAKHHFRARLESFSRRLLHRLRSVTAQ
jgi:hypothetical protein